MNARAVILSGGMGTRLHPLTLSIPKPLLPVGEKPILETIVEHLKDFGFRDFIFSVGYRSELIETYFGDGSRFDVNIEYFKEDKPLGTAGTLPMIRDNIGLPEDEPFFMMNGDILTRLDVGKLLKHHRENDFSLTVGVKDYENKLPFGVLEIEDGSIMAIKEKPVERYHISAGIYVINPAVLDLVPKGEFFTIPSLIERLIEAGEKVGSYFIEEYWLAVENIGHIERGQKDIKMWQKD